ncbi:MAG: hypothetical protein WCP97_04370 [bacterium]
MKNKITQQSKLLAKSKVLFIALLAVVFIIVFLQNAWVVDDAYITFRTVDNAVRGYGFTWNTFERVQVYTHPLWMLLMTVIYFFTREAFYTVLVISLICCLGVLFVAYRIWGQKELLKLSFFTLALIASKTFMDYTSSGLEYPLLYLLLAVFYGSFLFRKKVTWSGKDLSFYSLIAFLSYCTRQDCILLFIAPIFYIVLKVAQSRGNYEAGKSLFLGMVPAICWHIFSIIYYGFPFPNTAYAKSMTQGVTYTAYLQTGYEFIKTSIFWDSFAWIVIITAIVACTVSKDRKAQIVSIGVVFYLLYIGFFAAIATHMSGRFIGIPFLLALFILNKTIRSRRLLSVYLGVIFIFTFTSSVAPIKANTFWYKIKPGGFDTRAVVCSEGACLVNIVRGKPLPDHQWFLKGETFRYSQEVMQVGGGNSAGGIGYFGYTAGPKKIIIDPLGLADPLLARIAIDFDTIWQPGHFSRHIPEGYYESVRRQENLIHDSDLQEYYGKIKEITQGDLLSWSRIKTIYEMNTGRYSEKIEKYNKRRKIQRQAELIQSKGNVKFF